MIQRVLFFALRSVVIGISTYFLECNIPSVPIALILGLGVDCGVVLFKNDIKD